jgi:DNA-binding CsgD family transcriptional regulator
MHADYERIRQHDYLAKETVASVNQALVFNDICERPETSPELRAYLEKWRTAHSMVCARIDPFTDLATGIAIWRERRDQRYAEAERRLFEAAVPHLIESYAINRIWHVVRVTQPRSAALYASAIADARARLQVAPLGFQNLLRREWPGWRGNGLPNELAHLFGDGAAPRHVGRRVFLRAARVQGLFLVQARTRRPADELTPRELQIARFASAGLSYKQVAARLAISAATVRTHLSAIYGKLAVHKQAELLPLLDEVR